MRQGADGCVPFAPIPGVSPPTYQFSASATCENEGGYIVQGETYSIFYEYGTNAASFRFGAQPLVPALPAEGARCKATTSDTYTYDQVGPGTGPGGNCWPFLLDTTKPDAMSSITWTCGSPQMLTVIDEATPYCNTAAALAITSASATPVLSSSGSRSPSSTPLSPSRSNSASLGTTRSCTPTESSSSTEGFPSRTTTPSNSLSPSQRPVLAYASAFDGTSCDRQYELNARAYPYEFLSAVCPYQAPAPPLNTFIIAAIAFASLGGITVILILVICYCQMRRAMALRKQRVSSVKTLMNAKNANMTVVAPRPPLLA